MPHEITWKLVPIGPSATALCASTDSFTARESSWFCFEIPSRDNVLRAFCFLYEMKPDVRVMLLGELRFANQFGMNSRAHHICCRLILRRYRRGLRPQYVVTLKVAKFPGYSLEVIIYQFVFRLILQLLPAF